MKNIEPKIEKGKILVIEDNKYWQATLREFLEYAGFFVEVVSDLEEAINKVKKDSFHFVTIDMQLDEKNTDKEKFEGWEILETVNKLRLQNTTPVMVVTGFELEYEELKVLKQAKNLFFMGKGDFDRAKFIEIVERMVKIKDFRFKNDHKGN